jgi:hypothetical protein
LSGHKGLSVYYATNRRGTAEQTGRAELWIFYPKRWGIGLSAASLKNKRFKTILSPQLSSQPHPRVWLANAD